MRPINSFTETWDASPLFWGALGFLFAISFGALVWSSLA